MIKINNKRGFTLVELLAVIVILAIILVIAVPKVMSIIEDSKKATLESTTKMIASSAEKAKVQNQVLGKEEDITCDSVAKKNDLDYTSCIIKFDRNTAKVTIIGNGKFEGLNVCNGTKSNATATNESCGLITLIVNLDGGTDTVDYNAKYEAGSTVTLESPIKEGYTFNKWTVTGKNASVNGNKLIIGTTDTKVQAIWSPNTNTRFVVNHYIEDLNSNTYTLEDVQNFTGTTDTSVIPEVNSYTGFTSPSAQTKTILGDGSLVINYYYTRNSYTYTLNSKIGVDTTGSTITGNYEYGETITLSATPNTDYTFRGWESSDPSLIKNITTQNSTFTMPAADISMTANVNELYLYNNGINYTDITGGWMALPYPQYYGANGATPSLTYDTDNFVAYLNSGSNYGGKAQINNVIDLSLFKKITIKYVTSRSGEWSGAHLRIFANDNNNSILGDIGIENTSISTASIDLSGINSECYIALVLGTSGANATGGSSRVTVYSLKLEYN